MHTTPLVPKFGWDHPYKQVLYETFVAAAVVDCGTVGKAEGEKRPSCYSTGAHQAR